MDTLPFKVLASTCQTHSSALLGFPTWYEFLPLNSNCSPELTNINDVWFIVAAIIEILLRIAAIMAVIFVIYGGVQYIISHGSPDQTDKARKTIIASVVGLVIAISSSILITFITRSLLGGS